MPTVRIPFASVLVLAAMLLTACQPLTPPSASESTAEHQVTGSSEEILYVATGGTIFAYRVDAQGTMTLLDSVPIRYAGRLRVAKKGRYLMAITRFPASLSAVHLGADGRFAGAPFLVLEGSLMGDIEISGSGEYAITIHEEHVPCNPCTPGDRGLHEVVSVVALSESDSGLETKLVGETRFFGCSSEFCYTSIATGGNSQVQGQDFAWLYRYIHSGRTNGTTTLVAISLDPTTGELDPTRHVSLYASMVPVGRYVIGVTGGWFTPSLAGHVFPDVLGKPLWSCGHVRSTTSHDQYHDGCYAGRIYTHSSTPHLFTVNWRGELWSFPFSPTSGPDVSRAKRTVVDTRPPQDWFLLPNSKLLVGFGHSLTQFDGADSPKQVMFAFRVNANNGELEPSGGPPGGFPEGVSAITYRPAPK